MHLSTFSVINRHRSESPEGFNHKLSDWTLSDWFTATVGELGEAANVAKKMSRLRDGIPGNSPEETEEFLQKALADEIADTLCYLDLLAQSVGIDLEQALIDKFNRVSWRRGTQHRLSHNG